MTELETLALTAKERIAAAATQDEVEAIRVEMLGRKGGALANLSKDMGKLSADERKALGILLNAAKNEIESALEARTAEFASAALAARLESEWVDITTPPTGPRRGSLLALTQIHAEIEDIFV